MPHEGDHTSSKDSAPCAANTKRTVWRKIGSTFTLLIWGGLILYIQLGTGNANRVHNIWLWLAMRFVIFDVLWTIWVLRLIDIWWQPPWLRLRLIAAERNVTLVGTAIFVLVVGAIVVALVMGLLGFAK